VCTCPIVYAIVPGQYAQGLEEVEVEVVVVMVVMGRWCVEGVGSQAAQRG
jgi:hypothetical protein